MNLVSGPSFIFLFACSSNDRDIQVSRQDVARPRDAHESVQSKSAQSTDLGGSESESDWGDASESSSTRWFLASDYESDNEASVAERSEAESGSEADEDYDDSVEELDDQDLEQSEADDYDSEEDLKQSEAHDDDDSDNDKEDEYEDACAAEDDDEAPHDMDFDEPEEPPVVPKKRAVVWHHQCQTFLFVKYSIIKIKK